MTKSDGKTPQKRLNYGGLVESIARLHMRTQVGAAAAVNQFLTLRNWLIGACIVEFEQRGSDRARMESGCCRAFPRIWPRGESGAAARTGWNGCAVFTLCIRRFARRCLTNR